MYAVGTRRHQVTGDFWLALRYLFREKVILASRCDAWECSSQSSSGDRCTASIGLKQPEHKSKLNHWVTFLLLFFVLLLLPFCFRYLRPVARLCLRACLCVYARVHVWQTDLNIYFFFLPLGILKHWRNCFWVPGLSGREVLHYILRMWLFLRCCNNGLYLILFF